LPRADCAFIDFALGRRLRINLVTSSLAEPVSTPSWRLCRTSLLSLLQPVLAPLPPDLLKFILRTLGGKGRTLVMIDLLALATFAQSIDIEKILCSSIRKPCNQ
jgi:hypothetical protein